MTTAPLSPSATVDPDHPGDSVKRWFHPLRKMTSSYTFRIVMQGIFTIWAVTTFTFFLIRQMPGNPVQVRIDQLMQSRGLSLEEATSQAAGLFSFDPSKPIIEQYLDYMGNLLRGDMGQSITSAGTPVIDQIMRYLPWTLFSVGLGLIISFGLGVLIGVAMAYWRGSLFDNVMTALASVLSSIPDYVVALLLILVAGVQLKLFDVGELRGGVSQDVDVGFTLEYLSSVVRHAMLPVLTYVLTTIGVWMLSMKSSTLATLGEDYITVAKARGLSDRRILSSYVGRNALLPLVTRLAISIGFVVGGSVVVEELFQYPGLGRALYRVTLGRDYTTMQGIFLVITFSVVISNILAELLFGWLDPRVRLGEDQS